jgi:adenylate cyclase
MANLDADRKLVAILCADVSGFSRMIGEDEEGTLAALAAHMTELIEPAIAHCNGRIVKTTGDGLLAEFASPVAAAHAALTIQDGLRSRNADIPEPKRQWLRVGLTLGDVKVRGGDIFGDAVNVAARLQSHAEPGSVYASAAVIDQLRGHAGFAWTDVGEKALKNIARPVRVYRLAAGATAVPSVWATLRRRARPRLVIGVIAIAALVAVGGYALWNRIQPQAKPSVAVLPFVNQSGDPVNDYFAAGVTDAITNALGRFKDMTVKEYKGKAAQPVDVAREVRVQYLVEGTVLRTAERVHVSFRLTDDEGTVLWPDQFDEPIEDIIALQDKIAQRVAGKLVATLYRVIQAKPPDNSDAYGLVLRGYAKLQTVTRADNREAKSLFEQALHRDPNYAAAYDGLGYVYLQKAGNGWDPVAADMLDRAVQNARTALSHDPDDVDAHLILSDVHSIQGRHDEALGEIDRALALNPSYAAGHSQRGVILLFVGRAEEAVPELEAAFDLDPYLPPGDAFSLGLAYYTARRHDDAVRFLVRETVRNPDYVENRLLLAAAYAQLGRNEDAEREAEWIRPRRPVINPETYGSRFRNRADHDYLIEGLRKAGLI